MEERQEILVELFRKCQKSIVAIGNETRQAIILTLLGSPSGGMRVGEIAKRTHLSQPSVSHHLRILCDSKLVEVRKSGTMNFYRALVDRYQDFDKLTVTMLNEFVEKILIHERDRKGSTDTTQEVDIYFNFIGHYIPPHFGEVHLTPEEEEARRKKEAVKDRLHRAYLRRKENGAQVIYEARRKNKYQAKKVARLAAIHAEDIANGVYIPVKDLPNQELRQTGWTPKSRRTRFIRYNQNRSNVA